MAYTATARQTQRTPRENRQYLVCRGGDESSEVIGCQGTLPLVDLSASFRFHKILRCHNIRSSQGRHGLRPPHFAPVLRRAIAIAVANSRVTDRHSEDGAVRNAA